MFDVMEIESAILAALVRWGKNELKNETEELSEIDFATDILGNLFVKMKECGFDNNLLALCLEDFEREYLTKIKNRHCFISEFLFYVRRLKELTVSRRIKERMTALVLTGDHVVATPEELISIANEEAKRLNNQITDEYLNEYIESLDKPRNCIKFGYGLLDKTTGGIEVPGVCIIGARPSTGKTTFALNIAKKAAERNEKALIFSLEMVSRAVIDRLISSVYNIDYSKFTERTLTEKDKNACRVYTKWLKDKGNIKIIDNIYNIEGISTVVRREKPKLVIIDYIQIVTTLKRHNNTREQINHISTEIKRMSKDNNCGIIVLSQLKRDGTRFPTMADLKESGSLEADGDYVLLMHRPYVLDKRQYNDEGGKNPEPHETQILVDKNKYGKCGTFDFHFNGQFQKFTEVDKNNEQLP